MKRTNPMDYVLAIQVYDTSNYFHISDNPYGGENERERSVVVPSRDPNPEEVCIKRDTLDKLSEEAKEVIKLILDSPAELFEMMRLKSCFRDQFLFPYLKRQFGIVRRKRVMDELKEFVGQFQK